MEFTQERLQRIADKTALLLKATLFPGNLLTIDETVAKMDGKRWHQRWTHVVLPPEDYSDGRFIASVMMPAGAAAFGEAGDVAFGRLELPEGAKDALGHDVLWARGEADGLSFRLGVYTAMRYADEEGAEAVEEHCLRLDVLRQEEVGA